MIVQLVMDGRLRQLELAPNGAAGRYLATLDGEAVDVQAELLKPGLLSLMIGDQAYRCVLEVSGTETAVQVAGERFVFELEDSRSLKSRRSHRGGPDGPMTLKAPMPGRVVRLMVAPGDSVEANQAVVVIEAMKMQNELKTPKAGRVSEIRVTPGEAVGVGQVLAVIA